MFRPTHRFDEGFLLAELVASVESIRAEIFVFFVFLYIEDFFHRFPLVFGLEVIPDVLSDIAAAEPGPAEESFVYNQGHAAEDE